MMPPMVLQVIQVVAYSKNQEDVSSSSVYPTPSPSKFNLMFHSRHLHRHFVVKKTRSWIGSVVAPGIFRVGMRRK